MPVEFLFPPGYATLPSMMRQLATRAKVDWGSRTFDELAEQGYGGMDPGNSRWKALAILTAGVVLLPLPAWACSVCVSWTEGRGLSAGFYWSALLLTALPFVVVAVIGVWLLRACRSKTEAR
jgi:hypothetical protein